MMMTGSSRCLALILFSRSMPEPPGMRMSETSTCGSSSSTIQMGFIPVGASWHQGDDDLEDRSSRLAFELDGAMVLLDECSCERETEAGASFATGHEREEDL